MIDRFRPLLDAARGLDLADPATAEAILEERFPSGGDRAHVLHAELFGMLEAGEIADRGEPPVRWSRVCKASDGSHGYSVDVVHMSAAGPRHLHPRGEIDYCIALDGEPRFDGRGPGWVVLPPGSRHVPTVTGGTMLIVYLLPEGEIEFG